MKLESRIFKRIDENVIVRKVGRDREFNRGRIRKKKRKR